MASSYRRSLEDWLSNLDVSADSVIDIGGSQLPVSKRVKSWDVIDYKIADLPNPHVDSPKPDIEVDMNYPNTFDEKYQVVFCLEVFEYIWNPVEAFKTLRRATQDGGTIYVTFPSIYPLHQPIGDDALRYMPAGIQKLAQNAGLVLVSMTPRKLHTNMWQQAISAEGMRAAKGEDHNFSGWICEFRK